MEAATATSQQPRIVRRRGDVIREGVSRFGLYAALILPLVAFGIHDLSKDGDLTHLGTNIVSGISNGAIIALIALGYTLVYGIIELINFAHGDLFMLGTLTSVGLYGSIGLHPGMGIVPMVLGLLAILVIAMATCALINVMIERVAYRPLRNAPKLAPLITAVGFSFILQNVGILWIGSSPRSVPDLIDAQHTLLKMGGVVIQNADVLAIAVTVPLVFLLTTFVARSRMGKAMRATAQDPDASRLMGINVNTTIALTFLLGGLMAGAAGLITALYQTSEWYFNGFRAGLFAFTAAVMGGIGNLGGAVAGGFIIGIIAQFTDDRLTNGNTWQTAVVFAFLIVVMIFRPQGLFGEQTREAG